MKLSRSCGYELIPNDAGKKGTFHYEFVNFAPEDRDRFFTERGQGWDGGLQLSALCPFSPQKNVILSPEYDPYSTDVDDQGATNEFVLGKVSFHFLHGEKISIRHDVAGKTTELRLDGYLEESESFKDYVIEVQYLDE